MNYIIQALERLDQRLAEFGVVRRFPTFMPESSKQQIYEQYAKAMARRRPEHVRGEWIADSFPGRPFIRHGKNFIIGYERKGVFFPSHFAPATMKGGVAAIQKAKATDSVFAVTPDLGDNLKRVGYKKAPEFLTPKVGALEGKQVYGSSVKALAKAASIGGKGSWEVMKDTPSELPLPEYNPRRRLKPKGPKHQNKRPWRLGDFWDGTSSGATKALESLERRIIELGFDR